MAYTEKTLLPDETVFYQARLHWFRYVLPVATGMIGLIILLHRDGYPIGSEGEQIYISVTPGWILVTISAALIFNAWFDQLTSEFMVTGKRVLIKTGFIRRRTLELLITWVESIRVDQSILGRLFGFGTIVVLGTGGSRERFSNLDDPLEFRWQVQAIASGDLDAVAKRKALRDEAEARSSRLPAVLDRRLKWIAVCALTGIAGAVMLTSMVGRPTPEAVSRNSASPSDAPQSSTPVEAPVALDNAAVYPPARDTTAATDQGWVPAYDIAAYCRGVSDGIGGSVVIERSCRERETTAKARLQQMALSDALRRYCDEVVRATGGGYAHYEGCVEQEMQAFEEPYPSADAYNAWNE